MAKKSDIIWSLIGIVAVVVSGFLLYRQVQKISLADLEHSLRAIPLDNWLLTIAATLGAYGALAWYDRIALLHQGKKVSWWFVTLCSFTTYALAHNIGASVFSGALVRYRAYRTKGMSAEEIGIVIVFCTFTFVLGSVLAGGVVLVLDPAVIDRVIPTKAWVSVALGALMLLLVALYILGSWRQFKPWNWRKFHVEYPRLGVVWRQLLAGPLEVVCAAGIIYFALPEANHPGYLVILGVFLASFSLALLSHAPGGLGVLEVTFITALPEIPTADVLAALIVFRCLYLLIPFGLSLFVVSAFEWNRWQEQQRQAD